MEIWLMLALLSAPVESETTAHERDGVFVRLGIGAGYGESRADQTTVTGAQAIADLDAGWMLSRRLAVFVRGFLIGFVRPDVEGGTAEEPRAALFGAGLGATRYTTRDIFFGGALLFARQRVDGLPSGDELSGGVIALHAGREWWVAPELALGFSAKAYGGQLDSEFSRWYPFGLSLNVVATYH